MPKFRLIAFLCTAMLFTAQASDSDQRLLPEDEESGMSATTQQASTPHRVGRWIAYGASRTVPYLAMAPMTIPLVYTAIARQGLTFVPETDLNSQELADRGQAIIAATRFLDTSDLMYGIGNFVMFANTALHVLFGSTSAESQLFRDPNILYASFWNLCINIGIGIVTGMITFPNVQDSYGLIGVYAQNFDLFYNATLAVGIYTLSAIVAFIISCAACQYYFREQPQP